MVLRNAPAFEVRRSAGFVMHLGSKGALSLTGSKYPWYVTYPLRSSIHVYVQLFAFSCPPRMNFLLLQFLICVACAAGCSLIAYVIHLYGRRQVAGSAHTTPQHTSSWPPPTTQHAGDASDAVTVLTNDAASLDGRGENLTLSPPAANKAGSNVNVGHHNQQSSTFPIHMDGAER